MTIIISRIQLFKDKIEKYTRIWDSVLPSFMYLLKFLPEAS